MTDKTAFQKLYEKFTMIVRNPSELKVMVARDQNNKPKMILCAGKVPIAIILTSVEIEKLKPNFETSEIINDHFKMVSSLDTRSSIKEFNSEVLQEHFSIQRIDELMIDW